jgi:hypothetical protein
MTLLHRRIYLQMRAMGWFIVLLWGIGSVGCAFAQTGEFPPLPVVSVEPGTQFPSPFPLLTPPPPIAGIPDQTPPSPISPSEQPSDYYAPPIPAPPFVLHGNFVDVNADEVRTTFEAGKPVMTIARGRVTTRYQDYIITSPCAEVDFKTYSATFSGGVVFQTGSQQVFGETISLNLRTGRWVVSIATSTINPQFAKGYLKAPVFANAPLIDGVKRQSMFVNNGKVTTCNLTDPHYELVAKSVAIYPNVRIVLRDASFYALGKRLVTFRRLAFPLREVMQNTELIPKVGQTVEEGFYAKFAYPMWASAGQSGLFLLDAMSRKGIGTGLKDNYTIGNATGVLQAYTLADRNTNERTNTGSLEHSQSIGDVKFNLSSYLRSNSYLYAPQSQSLTNRATFTHNSARTNSSLVFGYQANDAFTRTSTTTGNLKHEQRFGDSAVFQSLFDYIDYNSTGSNRGRLTSDLSFTKKENKFDWSITALKQTDLTDEAFVSGGRFGGIEKLPELALISDSARLGKSLPFGLPAQMRFSFGEFAEINSGTSTLRTFLELSTSARRHSLSETWKLLAGGGFRQYAYGDNTAQYAFDASAQLRKKLGEESSFDLTYRFQRPNGFTPFRFDFVSNYNIINTALNLKSGKNNKFSLLTGYNFEQKQFPWQDAVIRWSVQPTRSVLLYTGTGYNFNQSRWRSVINQLRVRSDDDLFRFDLGTRYDTTVSKLSSIRGLLDMKVNSKTRLQANAGYNGLTGNFDYQNFKITRDLHCWEASLIFTNQTGFYKEQGIRLNLRIKAFPLFEDFGVGTFGQALDTSVGEVY